MPVLSRDLSGWVRARVQRAGEDTASLRELEVAASAAELIILPIFTLSRVQAIFQATLKDLSAFLRVR